MATESGMASLGARPNFQEKIWSFPSRGIVQSRGRGWFARLWDGMEAVNFAGLTA